MFKFNTYFKLIKPQFSSLLKCLKLSNSKITILTLEYIRMTLEEYESTEEVLIIVKEFVKTTDSQIQVI